MTSFYHLTSLPFKGLMVRSGVCLVPISELLCIVDELNIYRAVNDFEKSLNLHVAFENNSLHMISLAFISHCLPGDICHIFQDIGIGIAVALLSWGGSSI